MDREILFVNTTSMEGPAEGLLNHARRFFPERAVERFTPEEAMRMLALDQHVDEHVALILCIENMRELLTDTMRTLLELSTMAKEGLFMDNPIRRTIVVRQEDDPSSSPLLATIRESGVRTGVTLGDWESSGGIHPLTRSLSTSTVDLNGKGPWILAEAVETKSTPLTANSLIEKNRRGWRIRTKNNVTDLPWDAMPAPGFPPLLRDTLPLRLQPKKGLPPLQMEEGK